MKARHLDDAFAQNLHLLYTERLGLYELALRRVTDSLAAVTSDRERFTVSQQRRLRVEHGRIKEAARLLAKAQNPKYDDRIKSPEDVFEFITDIAATRVTCNTVQDVLSIAEAIRNSATLRSPVGMASEKVWEDYIQDPKPSGYRAVHLLVEVDVPQGSQFVPVICEIQVRTLLQHAWGELTHEDTFKPEVKLPTLVSSLSKRLATTLAVLDEIAQDLRDELEKIENEAAISPESELHNDGNADGEQTAPGERTSIAMVREVFEETVGRPLAITRNQEKSIIQHYSSARLIDRTAVKDALVLTRRTTVDVFARHPVQLSDYDILEIAKEYPRGSERVTKAAMQRAAAKEEHIDTLRKFEDDYAPGEVFVGTLVRVTPRYGLLQLQSGDTAILSARHIEAGSNAHINLENYTSPGESLRVEVVNADARERRIEVRPADRLEVR